MLDRRSVREYTDQPLTIEEISQLLWAAQGITRAGEYRTAPSAGALYPLEIYIVVGNVERLPSGIYRYDGKQHELTRNIIGDKRSELCAAALGQEFIRAAAVNIIISADYNRTTWKYGQRGIRYVDMEAGHVAQNISLQAVALNLGTIVVGAFHDDHIKEIVGLPANLQPLSIIPVGRKK